jgi:glycosyltransferase involved in cell wall biosynthesis
MEHPNKNSKWVVYVSTFPPRACGIATFTQDLSNAFNELYAPHEETKIVAMNLDKDAVYDYDKKKVIFEIIQPDETKYVEAAHFLNDHPQVSIINIQHEFGIFGGLNGSHIIIFLRELKKPAVITFHTVLPKPELGIHDTVCAIDNHVRTIVVMTETSKKILVEDYGINPEKIKIIPHGIHSTPYSDGVKFKKKLKLDGKITISTFGLLSEGKGIEYGIEAMAGVVKKFPKATYLIGGATHPVVLKNEGEKYRNKLTALVQKLGLEKNVIFYNKYMTLTEVLEFLSASDIYLAPPQNPIQAVSGTLSYALGCGKPVVSTAFSQAKEDITPDIGILVGFNESDEIRDAFINLISDKTKRNNMGMLAYFKTRSRTWQNVILNYMREYITVVPDLGETEKNLPKTKLDHLIKMTDDTGLFQFAKLTDPDPTSGYTTDDNARALIAMVKYYEETKRNKSLPLINTYLNFLDFVSLFGGGFHNYVNGDKTIGHEQQKRENLESANSRAIFALARTAVSPSLPEALKEKAAELFRRNIKTGCEMTSIRSISYFIKALSKWTVIDPSPQILEMIRERADKLVKAFAENSDANWKWFEDVLAYSNGLMPDALVDAYKILKNEKYLSVAREAMDFLVAYSFDGEICVPIGQSGWLKRGSKKTMHDQQPEEVAMLVLALKSIYQITRNEQLQKKMHSAFNWFLGNNTLRQVVYDQATGGCYDGLGEKSINLNQGAESTVMYLLARLAFE